MAKEREVLPAVITDKGQIARFFVNDSKDPTSKDCWRMQVEYNGEPDSTLFEVPSHWHALHDEYWTMLEGRMLATVDGKTFTMTAGDDTVCVPRGHVHGLKAFKGERAVLTESSVPGGEFKQWFIRDMFQEQTGLGPSFWVTMRAFFDGDTYPALGGPLFLDRIFITVVGSLAKLIAPGKQNDKPTTAS